MKKTTFYLIIIAVLICSNAYLLLHDWMHPHHRPEGPKKYIIEQLHFNSDQTRKYEILIAKHRAKIDASEKKLIHLKTKLYIHLGDSSTTDLLEKIGLIQHQIECTHIEHFKEIKALCTTKQRVYFTSLQQELAHLFQQRKRKEP